MPDTEYRDRMQAVQAAFYENLRKTDGDYVATLAADAMIRASAEVLQKIAGHRTAAMMLYKIADAYACEQSPTK